MARKVVKLDGKYITKDGKPVVVNFENQDDVESYENIVDEQTEQITQNDGVIDSIEELLVNGYVDGSPRGVYDNKSALESAFPNGAIGVYATKDNGHWYYWNGTAWADGGVYHSAEATISKNYGVVNGKTDYESIRTLLSTDGYRVIYFEVEGYLDPVNSVGISGRYEAFLSGDDELYFRNANGIYHYITDSTVQGYYVTESSPSVSTSLGADY